MTLSDNIFMVTQQTPPSNDTMTLLDTTIWWHNNTNWWDNNRYHHLVTQGHCQIPPSETQNTVKHHYLVTQWHCQIPPSDDTRHCQTPPFERSPWLSRTDYQQRFYDCCKEAYFNMQGKAFYQLTSCQCSNLGTDVWNCGVTILKNDNFLRHTLHKVSANILTSPHTNP